MIDESFWLRMHGATTHFPIALVLTSMLMDLLGYFWPSEARRREFHIAGFYLLMAGTLTSFGAVLSGLIISKWAIIGTGLKALHHLFVWPSFGLMIALALWRLRIGHEGSRRGFEIYLIAMILTSALIAIAGYWGGEMILGPETADPPQSGLQSSTNSPLVHQREKSEMGRHLFAVNCAHCHGIDASGDEGPDLHGVQKSDARIAAIIQMGIKGEMPRFGQKLNAEEIQALIAYLRAL